MHHNYGKYLPVIIKKTENPYIKKIETKCVNKLAKNMLLVHSFWRAYLGLDKTR